MVVFSAPVFVSRAKLDGVMSLRPTIDFLLTFDPAASHARRHKAYAESGMLSGPQRHDWLATVGFPALPEPALMSALPTTAAKPLTRCWTPASASRAKSTRRSTAWWTRRSRTLTARR
jgi:hypothetical protein